MRGRSPGPGVGLQRFAPVGAKRLEQWRDGDARGPGALQGAVDDAAAVGALAEPLAPGDREVLASLDVLRRLSDEPRTVLLGLSPFRRVSRDQVAASMQIEPALSTGLGGAGRNDRPLFAVPAIPAGEYRLVPRPRTPAGWLMIGIGQDQFAI